MSNDASGDGDDDDGDDTGFHNHGDASSLYRFHLQSAVATPSHHLQHHQHQHICLIISLKILKFISRYIGNFDSSDHLKISIFFHLGVAQATVLFESYKGRFEMICQPKT